MSQIKNSIKLVVPTVTGGWTITPVTMPSSIDTNTPTSVNVAVANSGAKGRPGIVVKFERDAASTATCELYGRTCTPTGSVPRDQWTSANATCALGIARNMNFTGTDYNGRTEYVRVTCSTSGTLLLNVTVDPITYRAIPSLSDQFTITVP
mgnify:CR=1 FL=1